MPRSLTSACACTMKLKLMFLISTLIRFFFRMSSVADGVGAQGTSSDPIDVESMDPKCPIWRHVNKIKGSNPFGGNTKSECKFCEKVITGSYTRVRAHLLKIPNCGVSICKKVTIPILEQLQKEVAEAEAIVNAHQPNNIPLLMQQGSARASKRKNKLGLKKVFTLKFVKKYMLSLQGCFIQQVCILYLDTNC
jgi:hypothetical protein